MKWRIFALLFLFVGLFEFYGCESGHERERRERAEALKRVLESEPSEWVKEWVKEDYHPPKVDHPTGYYLYNINNPKIGMYKNEFVPNFISFDDLPIIMSSRHISSSGVMETWQYGPLHRPRKEFIFLDDKLISVFER